jgi:hypothetical protein
LRTFGSGETRRLMAVRRAFDRLARLHGQIRLAA